jgi:hypothetical protein
MQDQKKVRPNLKDAVEVAQRVGASLVVESPFSTGNEDDVLAI